MTYFIISYDTHRGRNYQDFYDAMDEHGGVKLLESVYGISLNNTSIEVRNWLRDNILDSDDSIMVVPVAKGKGYATSEMKNVATRWLKEATAS